MDAKKKQTQFEQAVQDLCDKHGIELVVGEPVDESGQPVLSRGLEQVIKQIGGASQQQSSATVFGEDGLPFSLEEILFNNHVRGTWVLISPAGRIYGGVKVEDVADVLSKAAAEKPEDVERKKQDALQKAALLASGAGGHG